MSNLNDSTNKNEGEEEILVLQDKDYFAEQNKQFEELRLKLQSLKDENKRQMDIIINSLDQLMAEKTYIDKTLEELHISDYNDPSPGVYEPHFKVVDYLAKVTGYDKDTDSDITSNESFRNIVEQSARNIVKQCSENGARDYDESVESKTGDSTKSKKSEDTNLINKPENSEIITEPEISENQCQIKTELPITEKKCSSDENKTTQENEILLQNTTNNSTDVQNSDDSNLIDK